MVKISKTTTKRSKIEQVLLGKNHSHSKTGRFRYLITQKVVPGTLLLSICLLLFISSQNYIISFHSSSSSHRTRGMAHAHTASKIAGAGKPFLLYGTAWKKELTAKYVSEAIHAGFRFIDTACQPKHYQEDLVGEGWTTAAFELGLQRSDLFLQTKYTPVGGQDPNRIPYNPNDPPEEQVRTSLAVSLKNLKTDYIDSLVLHSPLNTYEDTMKVWRVMESFVDDGKVLQLGISNCYDYSFFTALYEDARIKPKVLQNRFYDDSNFDTDLRKFCKEHKIWYQSFWVSRRTDQRTRFLKLTHTHFLGKTLTANRQALALPEVAELAKSHNLTPQTLMFAFLMSLGYVTPLSGTTNPVHMSHDVGVMERIQGGEIFFKSDEELKHFAELLGMPDM